MNTEKKSIIWKKFKKIFINVAIVLAVLGFIYSAINLFTSDIPSLIRGYEEIPIEYIDDYDFMGMPTTSVSKTVKKEISFEEGLAKIVDRLFVFILSGAVIIATPAYLKSESESE